MAHTIDYVCSKMLNSWFKSWVISFTFQVFWMKVHSKLNKFSIKKLGCYIVSDLRFLLEIQAILPKTSPFLFAQMAVLSSFFSNLYNIYLGCIALDSDCFITTLANLTANYTVVHDMHHRGMCILPHN